MRKFSVLLTIVSLMALLVIGCSTSNNPFTPDTKISMAPVVIPQGATVLSVTLNVYVSTPNNQIINIHRVTAPWDETTVTHNNFGSAYDATVIGSFTADDYFWHATDITDLFNNWSNGTYPNYGVLLDQVEQNYPLGVFHTKEAPVGAAYIEVCYELDGVVTCENSDVIGDTYITALSPDNNYGTLPIFYTGWLNETELEKQALLQFEIDDTPPEENPGCSHTIGFWKTHAGFGPQADVVSQYLPISLGSFEVADAQTAVDVLKKKTYGSSKNGITKLMAQLLGTKLSIASGADDSDIASTVAEADAFLSTHTFEDWDSLSDAEQQYVLDLKDMCDAYNNGDIGPGHCD